MKIPYSSERQKAPSVDSSRTLNEAEQSGKKNTQAIKGKSHIRECCSISRFGVKTFIGYKTELRMRKRQGKREKRTVEIKINILTSKSDQERKT